MKFTKFGAWSAIPALALGAFGGIAAAEATQSINTHDICVKAVRVDDSSVFSQRGNCPEPAPTASPSPTVSESPTASPVPTETAEPIASASPSPTATQEPVNNFATVTFTKSGAATSKFRAVAASSDGQRILGSDGGYLKYSTNGGASFVTTNGSASRTFDSVSMSADGTKLLAAHYDFHNNAGYIWISTNSGSTWQQKHVAGAWGDVAMTPDGKHMVVSSQYSYGYAFSRDGGVTWSQRTIPKPSGDTINRYLSDIEISDDGSKIIAGDSANVYLSLDNGLTWVHQPALTGKVWRAVDTSGDGKTLIASGDSVMISTDNGANWRQANLPTAGTGKWGSAATSTDGTKMMVGKGAGYIYTSIDSGVTWIERPAAGTGGWVETHMLPDGSKFYAADYHNAPITIGTFGP